MPDNHLNINRDHWNRDAPHWVAEGEKLWAATVPVWGIWGLPEHDLTLLPKDMAGQNAIELGCGTGYVSGWMARRGARVTGIDLSDRQLATARRLAQDHGADIRLIEGNAEATGLPDASFDFAISEYGAAIWCDPHVWLAEAHRLLRPGGRLVFLGHHPLVILCTPDEGLTCDRALHRPYRDMRSEDWTNDPEDPGGIEFNLGIADWLALFGDLGFMVERYQELYAPVGAQGSHFGISADWSRDYPCEQVWHLQKPG